MFEFGRYNRPVEPRDRLSRGFAIWSILYEENMAKKAISGIREQQELEDGRGW